MNPAECPHKFVRLIERWYGQGKYNVFVCNECDETLMPKFEKFSLTIEKEELAKVEKESGPETAL
jgi:hypothetical protein